jgi:hypothetical protein
MLTAPCASVNMAKTIFVPSGDQPGSRAHAELQAKLVLNPPSTENFAAQGVGQDIANLIAYPILLLLAWAASRGSVRAYLAWLGILIYSVYSYAISAFDVRFNALFLVYVAVLGLSIYALIGGLTAVDPVRVKAAFGQMVPIRSTWIVLVVVALMFYVQWLSEDLPAILEGKTPQSLIDGWSADEPRPRTGHGGALAGDARDRRAAFETAALGFCLAPVLLTGLVLLAVGIVTLMTVLEVRGVSGGSWAIAAVFVVIGLILLGWRSDSCAPSIVRLSSRTCCAPPRARRSHGADRSGSWPPTSGAPSSTPSSGIVTHSTHRDPCQIRPAFVPRTTGRRQETTGSVEQRIRRSETEFDHRRR